MEQKMKGAYQVNVITEDKEYKNVDVKIKQNWVHIETQEYDYESDDQLKVMVPVERVKEIRGGSLNDEM